MLMSPGKLILLRCYALTLGRIAFFSEVLKKALIAICIKKSREKYVASSRYFNQADLKGGS